MIGAEVSTTQDDRLQRSPVRHRIRTLRVALLAVTLTLLLDLLALEFVSLGPHFAVVVLGVLPAISLFLAVLLELRKKRAPMQLSPRQRRVFSVMVYTTAFLTGLAGIPHVLERLNRQADAAAALEYFTLVSDIQPDDPGLVRTLAELERARRRLESNWPAHSGLPVTLVVFRDLQEYWKLTGTEEWARGGVACLTSGPRMTLPRELAASFWTETAGSDIPQHEMTHALMCQSLGRDTFYLTPRRVHEGLALTYSYEGWRVFPYRISSRARVWLSKEGLLAPAVFCTYQASGPPNEVKLFYATAWEFTRWLNGQYGLSTLEAAVGAVHLEGTFNEALLKNFGGTCEELYDTWRDSW